MVREVRVDDSLVDYLLNIVHATRESELVQVGVSTRGALSYYRAAQALAVVEQRDYVVPDDIKRLQCQCSPIASCREHVAWSRPQRGRGSRA